MNAKSLPRIGGFDILAKIGEGGIGTVYLAETIGDPRRRVAIKVLQSGVAVQEKLLLRFAREGRVGQSLHHPHIVTVLGSGEWEGTRYIVMEYVEGTPLSRRLPTIQGDGVADLRASNESLRERLLVIARIADALHFVHSHGIVHRDVKTGNILVRSDGHPFLTDFGLAKNVEVDSTLTSTGAFMGTPSYMPPEQILGRWQEVDHRSDVYSLGVTLFEVVTGRLPFAGTTYEILRSQVIAHEPPRFASLMGKPPVGLESVALRAMEKRREDRYPDAAAMRDDLLRIAEGARPRQREVALLVRRETRRLVRQRVKLGAAALTIVAAVFAILMFTFRSRSRAAELNGFFHQGFSALDRGELRQALSEFQKMVDLDPDSPEGHLCRAVAYYEYSQAAAWQEEVERAIRLGFPTDPARIESPFEWYCFGIYKRMSRQYAEAEEALEKSIAQDETLFQAHFALYEVRKKQKKSVEARAALLSYKRNLKEANPRFDLTLAQLEEDDGNYAKAASILEDVRRSHPSKFTEGLRIARQLGRNYLRLGQLKDAERELIEAITEYEDDAASMVNLSLALQLQERFDEAARLAARGLELDERIETGYKVLARCAAATGDEMSARDWLMRCARISRPEELRPFFDRLDAELAYREGKALQDADDLDGARPRFEECLQRDPTHFGATLLLASNTWVSGDLPKALELIDRTLDLFRQDASLDVRDRISATVGLFDVAAKLGLEDRVAEAARFLADHPPRAVVDAVNYVEALANCPLPEFRDVNKAQHWIRDENLREKAMAANRPTCLPILDQVEALEPR